MPRGKPLLTDAVWEKIAPFLPTEKPGPKGGRPRASNRACFEGILWILKTGSPWRFLPEQYPSPSTVWRRLDQWTDAGIWEDIWRAFVLELSEEEEIRWAETFMDGSFASAKKGAPTSERPSGERAQSSWYWQAKRVFLSESLFILHPRTNRPWLRRRSSIAWRRAKGSSG